MRGSVLEVFLVFLRLGCVSFGGPVAHLGYFQKALVAQRRWCAEDSFAEVLALAQSLPGPSSSQVAFALGIVRAGWLGGVAAWTGFTLPSALLMLGFAFGTAFLSGHPGVRLIHGLQIVAVAVVAQAILTMQRSLAPDRKRIGIAIVALAVALFGPGQLATILAIAGGAVAGLAMLRLIDVAEPKPVVFHVSKTFGAICGLVFFALLVSLPLATHFTSRLAVQALSVFYRSGAFVFGGGHVVLPLLENAVVAPGWVSQATFLSGYGAAQALPGPLFTFGAFLGATIQGTSHRVLFGLIGLFALSAPGLLAMGAVLPFWDSLRAHRSIRSVLRGVNAAVVGVLIAAFFTPLWVSTVHTPLDFWFTVAAFTLLNVWKVQPWMVVGLISVSYLLMR